jgi:hypothetical protein
MVDEHHITIWNRTKKPLSIALSGVGKSWGEEMLGEMILMFKISLIRIVTIYFIYIYIYIYSHNIYISICNEYILI